MNKEILPVLDEISALLKKHDMTGWFAVGNKTHCDFRIEVGASWSCASIERQPDGEYFLRVRSKKEDYPSKEAQHVALLRTVSFFVTLHDVLRNGVAQAEQIMLLLHRGGVEFDGRSIRED